MAKTNILSKTDQKIDELVLEADVSYVAAVFDKCINSAAKRFTVTRYQRALLLH